MTRGQNHESDSGHLSRHDLNEQADAGAGPSDWSGEALVHLVDQIEVTCRPTGLRASVAAVAVEALLRRTTGEPGEGLTNAAPVERFGLVAADSGRFLTRLGAELDRYDQIWEGIERAFRSNGRPSALARLERMGANLTDGADAAAINTLAAVANHVATLPLAQREGIVTAIGRSANELACQLDDLAESARSSAADLDRDLRAADARRARRAAPDTEPVRFERIRNSRVVSAAAGWLNIDLSPGGSRASAPPAGEHSLALAWMEALYDEVAATAEKRLVESIADGLANLDSAANMSTLEAHRRELVEEARAGALAAGYGLASGVLALDAVETTRAIAAKYWGGVEALANAVEASYESRHGGLAVDDLREGVGTQKRVVDRLRALAIDEVGRRLGELVLADVVAALVDHDRTGWEGRIGHAIRTVLETSFLEPLWARETDLRRQVSVGWARSADKQANAILETIVAGAMESCRVGRFRTRVDATAPCTLTVRVDTVAVALSDLAFTHAVTPALARETGNLAFFPHPEFD